MCVWLQRVDSLRHAVGQAICVELRGCKVSMPYNLLDRADIGSTLQEIGNKAPTPTVAKSPIQP